jgi:rhodanese-related sulfurtransferase
VTSYTPAHLKNNSIYQNLKIIDVRKPTEYLSEHIQDAENVPLEYLNDYLAVIPKNETFIVHCASGYRSLVASSILKARGYHNMIDVDGGITAMKADGFKVSDYVCPSTL